MEYFLILPSLAFLCCFIKNKKHRNWAYVLIMFLMFFLCAFRESHVGQDTMNYYKSYVNLARGADTEPLFMLIKIICRRLSFSFNEFLFVATLLIYIPLFIVFKKESQNPVFTALIFITGSAFYYCNTFNTVRFAIATSFVLLGASYIDKNKLIKGVCFLILSLGFHYSAIVALPIVIAFHYIKKISFQVILVSTIVTLGIGYITNFYADVLNGAFMFMKDSDSVYESRYSDYITYLDAGQLNIIGKFFTSGFFSILVLLCYNKKDSQSLYFKLAFLGGCLANIFMDIKLAYRIYGYFIIFIVLIVPNAFPNMTKLKKSLTILILALTTYIYVKDFLTSSPSGILPYAFNFD